MAAWEAVGRETIEIYGIRNNRRHAGFVVWMTEHCHVLNHDVAGVDSTAARKKYMGHARVATGPHDASL